MPCLDYYDENSSAYYGPTLEDQSKEIEKLKKQISFAESALCQTLAALKHVDSLVETVSPKQGSFYNWINVKEAGITTEQLIEWHFKHSALDAKHREEERLKKLRADALNKLTDEEKAVLGIKK